MDAIGSHIRAMRKAKGLTQVQLADKLGIDQSTVSDIERGKGFSAAILIQLAEFFGTSPLSIMRAVDGGPLGELEALFHRMDATKRATLMEVARSLGRDTGKTTAAVLK